MVEPGPQPSKQIIELSGVVNAESKEADGGIWVRAGLRLPGAVAVEFVVGADQVGVLRYAAAEDPDAASGYYDPPEIERVEFVGGSADDLGDSCFRLPGRRGGLRDALTPEMEGMRRAYLGEEAAKLERIERGQLRVRLGMREPPGAPKGIIGLMPASSHSRREQLLRQRVRHSRWAHQVEETLWRRQLDIVSRLASLASLDLLEGRFEPETARGRALAFVFPEDEPE
jgi:hypothetical protein